MAAGGTLEQLNAASVGYRIAVGPQAGRRTLTLRTLSLEAPQRSRRTKPFTAARDGFSVNVGVACEPFQTTTLERRWVVRRRVAVNWKSDRIHISGSETGPARQVLGSGCARRTLPSVSVSGAHHLRATQAVSRPIVGSRQMAKRSSALHLIEADMSDQRARGGFTRFPVTPITIGENTFLDYRVEEKFDSVLESLLADLTTLGDWATTAGTELESHRRSRDDPNRNLGDDVFRGLVDELVLLWMEFWLGEVGDELQPSVDRARCANGTARFSTSS